jgi:hypothetical protein
MYTFTNINASITFYIFCISNRSQIISYYYFYYFENIDIFLWKKMSLMFILISYLHVFPNVYNLACITYIDE